MELVKNETTTDTNGASTGSIILDLVRDFGRLTRLEFGLLQEELRARGHSLMQLALLFAGFAMSCSVAFLFLAGSVAFLLVEIAHWSFWLSFLVVGIVLAIGGGVGAFVIIKKFLGQDSISDEMVQHFKEDVVWRLKAKTLGTT